MTTPAPLDRRALVRRHNPVLREPTPTAVLTLGNGNAAMSVDASGLQTFAALHELRPDPVRVPHRGLDSLPRQRLRAFDPADFQIPLRTQTSWAMYSTEARMDVDVEDATTEHPTDRGTAPYLDRNGLLRPEDEIPSDLEAGAYLHFNPRRAHLGRLALVQDEELVDPDSLTGIHTELDLWTGTVTASYDLEGSRVSVTSVADPLDDAFGVRIESDAFDASWGIAWIFDDQPDHFASFEIPPRTDTRWEMTRPNRWIGHRTVGDLRYTVEILSDGSPRQNSDGKALVMSSRTGALETVVHLRPHGAGTPDHATRSMDELRERAETWWERHWTQGGVVSLEGSTDERASELERRIVLSQYLTAVNCAGATPPAETGLTYNTWSGKFHLEMHWWHAAHFPLWGRGELLERSLSWYHRALGPARDTARAQGYRGVRWQKQTDPTGRESPSNIGVFLLWQQPHIIYLLALLFDAGRDESFLREHRSLIEETANFMADFPSRCSAGFELPPPLVPAQESYLATRGTNRNPTFELAYWRWALETASSWISWLGETPDPLWKEVAHGLVAPTVFEDGTYAGLGSPPHLIREDHPSHLMALGWVPDTGFIDRDTMRFTLDAVRETWNLQSTWGWDYPVMAMAAIAVGDLRGALEALLTDSPKNAFLPNGHVPQIPGFLSLYLPANGGLLAAVAHLVRELDAPGDIPGWEIRAEGFPSAGRPDCAEERLTSSAIPRSAAESEEVPAP